MRTIQNIMMALGVALVMSACGQGSQNSPVTTPNTTPAQAFNLPADAPDCLHHQDFKDHDDMCKRLRDDRATVCASQDRYDYFQKVCSGMNWQDRDENARP